jgi:hypothetical protein
MLFSVISSSVKGLSWSTGPASPPIPHRGPVHLPLSEISRHFVPGTEAGRHRPLGRWHKTLRDGEQGGPETVPFQNPPAGMFVHNFVAKARTKIVNWIRQTKKNFFPINLIVLFYLSYSPLILTPYIKFSAVKLHKIIT